VSLVAVGDIMMHQDVKEAARQSADGLQGLWGEVLPLLRNADIAFGNLETPVAPVTGRPGVPFQFNAPEQLPAALRASGFTVLATANNHAFDQGPRGVRETLERLEAERLVAIGTGRTRAEAEQVRLVTVRGLRVAFLGFTDIFNIDLNRQGDQPWVRRLDIDAAATAVHEAKAQADLVVVSIHWGAEYQHRPLERQRQAAAVLAEAGAGLILGHHPHVLQPVAWVGQEPHRALVAFSMGNFVSNQDRIYDSGHCPVPEGDSRDGVALQCRLVKWQEADGSTRVELQSVRCEPLWTDNNWAAHRSGQARQRVIRVVPVNGAIRAAERDLGRLPDPGPEPKVQAWLRTLRLRRDRAAFILGSEFVN
jgi:poly-gamma-glutamate synthesis protein (capsule biosynthesis protein)